MPASVKMWSAVICASLMLILVQDLRVIGAVGKKENPGETFKFGYVCEPNPTPCVTVGVECFVEAGWTCFENGQDVAYKHVKKNSTVAYGDCRDNEDPKKKCKELVSKKFMEMYIYSGMLNGQCTDLRCVKFWFIDNKC